MTTKEKIDLQGKMEFLSKGFKEASLRNIASKAGVTTGAIYGYYADKFALFDELVREKAETLFQRFLTIHKEFCRMPAQEKEKEMYRFSNRALLEIISYVYGHFSTFKLIICCSAGTKYENFIDDLIEIEVKNTWAFINAMKSLGHPIQNISAEMSHILSSSYFKGIFETVAHDMSKENALLYVQTLTDFYAAGWDRLFQLKK